MRRLLAAGKRLDTFRRDTTVLPDVRRSKGPAVDGALERHMEVPESVIMVDFFKEGKVRSGLTRATGGGRGRTEEAFQRRRLEAAVEDAPRGDPRDRPVA